MAKSNDIKNIDHEDVKDLEIRLQNLKEHL